MAQWTDPSRSFLIHAVRVKKVLWDKDMATDAQCKAAKVVAFQEVTDDLNAAFPSTTKFSCEDVRSQWKNLKDTFVRKLRWVSEGKYTDDPLKEPTWKFYRMLSFLDEKELKRVSSGADTTFDLQMQRENDHTLHLVKNELHHLNQYDNSNHSATSEEQMLQMFVQQSYPPEKPSASSVSPPSPALPPVSNSTPCSETICAKPSYTNGTHGGNLSNGNSGLDDDDEPRRKRVYSRRMAMQNGNHQDEFDLFGACVAAQLKRLCDENSRSAALRLQKRLSDVIYESQIELLER
ncbi:unnamed protein product [Caenorhabditis auriculariae]|uniref:MADF domain-containing protein n=1 Tax=Caenorhabditis auriculariae TaxID=2777116 RepID=A0A8S1H1X0_9PELO|nr:unnamed protein product [Caenorhabditis auriculariae]